MKIRHVMLVLLSALLLFFVAVGFYLNRELLTSEFLLPLERSMAVHQVLLLAFMAGALVAFFLYRVARLGSNLTWTASRHFVKALNHLYADRYEDALVEIRRAARKSSANYDILMTMGVIFKRLKRYDESLDCFRRAFHRKNTVQAFLKIMDVIQETDMSVESEDLWKLCQKIRKEVRSAAYRALLDYLKQRGDWVLGFKTWQRGRKHDASRFPDEEGAEIRYELGKLRGSRRLMKDLLKEFPRFAPAYVALAELHVAAGDTDEALAVLKEGFSHTHLVVFLEKIEEHLLAAGDPERAVEELGQIVLNENHHLLARFYLGKLYYRLEMLEKAREIFEHLQGEIAYIPALPHYLARIYYRKGDTATAFRYMEELVERTDVLAFRFHCKRCHVPLDSWSERCPACHTINAVRMIYEELKADAAPIFML